jgi:hypothetical protein
VEDKTREPNDGMRNITKVLEKIKKEGIKVLVHPANAHFETTASTFKPASRCCLELDVASLAL